MHASPAVRLLLTLALSITTASSCAGSDEAAGTTAAMDSIGAPGEDGTTRDAGPGGAPNAAPVVIVMAPAAGDRLARRAALELVGFVTDANDSPETLVLTWSSDIDGPLGSVTPGSDGLASLTVPADTLTSGLQTLTVEATDPSGAKGSMSVAVRINTPPGAPLPAITPDPAGTAVDLVASVATEAEDADTDTITYTWTWLRDGVPQPTLTTPTVPATRTTRGETWSVRATPSDGLDEGPPGTATIVISDTPPALEMADVTPDAGDAYTTFRCSTEGWSDPDADDVRQIFVTWTVDGEMIPTEGICAAGCDEGSCDTDWSCSPPRGRCWPDDAVCDVDDDCPADTPVCRLGACVMSCAETGCPDGLACDAESRQCGPMSGLCRSDLGCGEGLVCVTHAGDLLVGGVRKGEALACVATPFDGYTLGEPVRSDAVPILNSAPELGSVVLTPEEGDVTTTFRCEATSTAFDPDGDPVEYSYLWQIKGPCGACVFEPLPGTTSLTLSNPGDLADDYFHKGDTVRCVVVPSDGDSSGAPVTSNEVQIENAAPTYGSVTMEPAPMATESDVLTCIAHDPSDPDGDGVSAARYIWWVNGELVEGVEDNTLSGEHFDKGDRVECAAVPTDGYSEGGIVVVKAPTRVVNTAPSVATVSLTPASGDPSVTFTCEVDGWLDPDPADSDGPGASAQEPDDVVAPELRFRWYRNAEDLHVAVTQTTLTPNDFAPGDELQCSVEPFDGQDAGAIVFSDVVRMSGPPSIGEVLVTPDDPTTTDDLLCDAHDVSDPDGDAVTLAYVWLRDGEIVEGQTGATLPANETVKGERWSCSVTPHDLISEGATVSSADVLVLNAPPSAPLVEVTPTDAQPGDELTCTIVEPSTDADGDAVTYALSWSLDGVPLDGETGEVIVSDPTIGCGAWRCTVTPQDSDGEGEAGWDELLTASGWALRFDGASDGVVDFAEIGHTDALSLAPQGQLTIEAWVRPERPGAGVIAEKRDPDGPGFTLATDEDGVPEMTVWGGDGDTHVVGDAALPPDRWAHLAASYEGTTVRLFVNGVLQPDTGAHAGSADSAGALHLGGVPGADADRAFAGRIDEVRLSSAAIYRTSFGPTLPVEPTLGTVGIWHLDEGEGTLFEDATGGGSVGAAVQTTWVEGMCVPTVNTPPTAPVVAVVPSPAGDNSDLRCVLLVESFDVDDDELTYTYRWGRDGVPVPAYDDTTEVPASETTPGETWTCTVTPNDGVVDGTSGIGQAEIVEGSTNISGTYTISPVITYTCAFGMVNLNYPQFTFLDDGETFDVSPQMNGGCTMTGPSARATGTFDATCTLYGGCNETYRIEGSFEADGSFTASYTVRFEGDCSGYDVDPCYNVNVPLTGTRVAR